KYKVYLSSLEGTNDVFDLLVSGGDVEFDYVVDPSVSACQNITTNGTYTLTGNVNSNSTCFEVNSSDVEINCAGYTITYSQQIAGSAVTALDIGNISVRNCVISIGNSTLISSGSASAINITNSSSGLMHRADGTTLRIANLTVGNLSSKSSCSLLLTTSTVSGNVACGNITIANGITISVDSTPSTGSKMSVFDAIDFTLPAGSSISSSSAGYGQNAGPGAGSGGIGGSYGGTGGSNSVSFYNSSFNPSVPGSGGGSGSASGGAGGGAIGITGDGVTINGNINSGGSSGGVNQEYSGGGGSGGTINIVANVLQGNGLLSAGGGDWGGAGTFGGRGGGGGGRIMVKFNSSTFYIENISVNGGSGTNPGQIGTIGYFDSDDNIFTTRGGWKWQQNDLPFNFANINFNNSAVRSNGVLISVSDTFSANNISWTDDANVTVLNSTNLILTNSTITTSSGRLGLYYGLTFNDDGTSYATNSLISLGNKSSVYLNFSAFSSTVGNLSKNTRISFARAFANSTSQPGLNVSTNITFLNITFANPRVLIDYIDDGINASCPATKCNTISYNSSGDNSLTLNVVNWTTYLVDSYVPIIQQVILNSTNPSINDTNQNLTAYPINAIDSTENITDWRLNNGTGYTSWAVLNMPFESNISVNDSLAVRDYSTYWNNGTLGGGGTIANMPNWTLSGKVGGAYVFDGTNDYIRVPDSNSLDAGTGQSFAVWVRLNGTSAYSSIFAKYNSDVDATRQYYILIDGSKIRWTMGNNNALPNLEVSYNFQNNVWYFITAVYSSSGNGVLYINGSSVGTQTGMVSRETGQPLIIGSYDALSNFFNGTIDELMIFPRNLSAAQVVQLYNDTMGGKHASTIVMQELTANQNWSVAVTPNDHNATEGLTVMSNNVTINPDAIFPTINFTNPAETSGSLLSRNNILVNVTSTDNYLANITTNLYNSTSLVNSSTSGAGSSVSSKYINITNLTDGIYYFNASATDTTNNKNYTETRNVTLDTTSPAINFTNPTETHGGVVGRNWTIINVTSTDTNFANVTIYLYNSTNVLINSTTTTTSPNYVNITNLLDGIYYFNASAYDTLGHSNKTETRNVTIDTTPPFIQILYPLEATDYNYIVSNLNYTYSDANSVQCWYTVQEIDSAVGACNNFSIASEYVVQGNNTWTVSIKDVVNNQNSTSVIFLVDTQVPQISFGTNSIVSGNYSTTLTTFNATYTDGRPKNITLFIYNSSGLYQSYTNTTAQYVYKQIILDEGDYLVNATAYDIGGNPNSTETRVFGIDSTKPLVDFGTGTPENGSSLAGSI
ncbi:LamG domain-containing protein, partial [Candidatus Pacearchaeota archaeon]|nr:LamG domain-containing protein [Candidatus Pacearchaeota archaeon]